jgi:hypothetical protein
MALTRRDAVTSHGLWTTALPCLPSRVIPVDDARSARDDFAIISYCHVDGGAQLIRAEGAS